MDEAARTERPPVEAEEQAQESRSPEEIRRDIEQTRAELGDTVEALAEKADVKSRAQSRLESLKGDVKRNPVPLAVGAGLVVGYLVWRRR